MRYGTLTDEHIRAACGSAEEPPKRRLRRHWNKHKAAENLLMTMATGAVVAVLAWMVVMWLTG